MIELRRAIQSELKTIHDRVYFHEAPDNSIWPYVIYDFPNSFMNEDQDVYNMDVDVWDGPPNGDTTAIETIASDIWRQLHKYTYLDEDIQFTIYKDNWLSLIDDDPRIKRRKLIFQVRYYDRRLNE